MPGARAGFTPDGWRGRAPEWAAVLLKIRFVRKGRIGRKRTKGSKQGIGLEPSHSRAVSLLSSVAFFASLAVKGFYQ